MELHDRAGSWTVGISAFLLRVLSAVRRQVHRGDGQIPLAAWLYEIILEGRKSVLRSTAPGNAGA